MMSAHSRFLPGTIITLLTAAISGQLKAAVISMTRSYTDATSGATRLVTFDQFDPSLGTLTAITLSATGASRGSFYVHNLDASEILTLNSSTIRIRATLTGDNAPVARIYSSSSAGLLPESGAAYFTGPGTVNFSIAEVWATNITGGVRTQDYSNLLMSGEATLKYVYDPTPVPEPGTWIMSTLLVTGIGAHWWRRRRRHKSRTTSSRSRISHGQSSRSRGPSPSGRVKIRHLIKLD